MAKRRPNHEGGLDQLPSGSWRASISLNGHRVRKVLPSQKAALEWLKEQRKKIDHGYTYEASQLKLGEHLDAWLQIKQQSLAANTYNLYKLSIRKHIQPYLGNFKLVDLNPHRIQTVYSTMLDKGLSARTVQIAHQVLHGALQTAYKQGLISVNPTDMVEVPNSRKAEMKIWTEDQVFQFLVSTRSHKYFNLYHLAIVTGMRRGELLGLRWSDIDWTNKVISVRQQVTWPTGQKFELKPPKTDSGRRNIDIEDGTIDRLRDQFQRVNALRQVAGPRWQEYDLVFPNTTGSPIYTSRFTQEFNQAVRAAGLPVITFHGLRHTAASLLLQKLKEQPFIVSKILGHSRPSITEDIYSHLLPNVQREAARYMDSLTTLTKLPDLSEKREENSKT